MALQCVFYRMLTIQDSKIIFEKQQLSIVIKVSPIVAFNIFPPSKASFEKDDIVWSSNFTSAQNCKMSFSTQCFMSFFQKYFLVDSLQTDAANIAFSMKGNDASL